MTDSDTGTYSWSSGIVGDTKLDAIRRAITLSMLAHFPPTGVVIHPTDWEAIETVKGTDGHYIWAAVPGGGVTPMVWRVPVVLSTAIESGDALIGAFALGVTIWDREESNIRISESHDDYFVRNMVAILAEERLAMTLNRPESFVALDFDSAPV
jgi:HK97 family phage major capsid protein